MTSLALLLVLLAAVLHATWNFCAKRAGGGLPFVYLVGLIICSLYVPVVGVYLLLHDVVLSWQAVAWIGGSGVLKTAYSLFLQRGYRTGDFSLIYPLARGTGPLLSTLAAIVILGERPTPLAMAGGAVIIASIFWLTGGWDRVAGLVRSRRSVRTGRGAAAAAASVGGERSSPVYSSFNYGLMSGVFIAAYTLWDRQGVAGLAVAPLLYDAGTAFTQLALLTPFALRRRGEVARHWREHRRYALGVALLSPIAYVLILTALTFTPVSYIAPAREVSIVIGAFIGARYLKEAHGARRLWAAVAMSAGVIALAVG